MKQVVRHVCEVDECHRSVALFGVVVPLTFAAQPGQQLAVAFNGGRQCVQGFHHGAHDVGRHPGVERCELGFQHVTEEGTGFAVALGARIPRRD